MTQAMRLFVRIICLALLVLPAAPSLAQEAVVEPTEIGQSGTDYLKSLGLRRIGTDVSYYDPLAPPPKLDTRQEPERQPNIDGDDVRFVFNLPWTLFATAVLLIIAYLFFRFGGSISVSLRSDAENARRAQVDAGLLAEDDGTPITLQRILGLADRRMAVVLLAQKALEVAVAANGVLFQRSWTARDALRRVKGAPEEVAALRSLVLESERVQFGGRDISEDVFQSHLSAVRPLIDGAGA